MNSALRLPKERADALAPQDLETYLLTHQWEEDRSQSSAKVGAFHHRSVPEVSVLVPRDRRFLDYALRVGDVLETIAVMERRTAWEVLEDLTARQQAALANGSAGDAPEGERSSVRRKSKKDGC